MQKNNTQNNTQKDILCLKRPAAQITCSDDINITDDALVDIARKIFVHHFNKKYEELDWCLYQTEAFKHSKYSNVVVMPHFIRDDGVVIYLQLVHNNIFVKKVQEEIIHVAMEILKTNSASLFTITLDPLININDMRSLLNATIAKSYTDIKEKTYKYSPTIAQSYLSLFSNKKFKPSPVSDITPVETNIEAMNNKFVRNDWVSASKTRNYALKDTLVDWLDFCHDKSFFKSNEQSMSKQNIVLPEKKQLVNNTTSTETSNEYDFTKYIMSKGNLFETKVIDLIKNKVGTNEFVTICNNMKNYDDCVMEYQQKTIDEIIKGTPIIYQPLMMNHSGPLSYSYGLPDLLVRSDYLDKIMLLNPYDKNMTTHRALNLKGNYHYVVVDIKFTTLELCADGIRIRNSGSIPAYKCQLYVYNHALGIIQGYEPTVSFILRRKYKYQSKVVYYSGNNCFDRFGHIEYNKWDKNYVDETVAAIEWIRKLRSDGKKWELLPKPSVPELYPNMSSVSDTVWDNFKTEYANKIGEISLLWNCGVKNRRIAHNNGVYSIWSDNCCSETVGINGSKQAPILDEIIKINKKRKFDDVMDRIFVNINKEVDNRWMDKCTPLRISVDFETINSVFDDFSELPKAQENNYLFMIGIAYKVESELPAYKMFLLAELSINAEFQIIYQFYQFLREITNKYCGKKMPIPSLYHWGHIENSFFFSLCNKLERTIGIDIKSDINLMKTKLNWYDLSQAFKNNPIVINGCYKFGLKEVARRLFELGLIKSDWRSNNSECVNGNTAMVMAQKTYQTSQRTGISIIQSPIMRQIMEYNKIDCIVIHEIVDLLQKKVFESTSDNNIPPTKKQKINK